MKPGTTKKLVILTIITSAFLAGPVSQQDTTSRFPADTTEVRFEDEAPEMDNNVKEEDDTKKTLKRTRKGRVYLDKGRLLGYIFSGGKIEGNFIQYERHPRKD